MSQLSDIQNAILRRFKQPMGSDQQDQSYLTDEQKRAAIAAASVGQTPQPVSPGNVAPQPSPWRPPDVQPVANLPVARPASVSPYAPPDAMRAPVSTQNVAVPAVDMASAGSPPARINVQTGEPHRETFSGDENASTEYRDALDRWKPTKHRSVGQVLKEGAIGFANGVAANPNNPWAGVGGAAAGIGSGVVQPNVINRAMKLNHANAQVEHDLGEQRARAQTEAIGSQQDAREAQIAAGQDRIRQGDSRISQGDERLRQGADRISQTAQIAHRRMLAGTYNSLKEFDPSDPRNARMVTEFTREMGYPPPKKTSGSMLHVEEGEDDQGNPTFKVIDAGAGTSTTVTGDLPTRTNNQLNRESRETQGALNRQNRTENVNAQQQGANNRAGQRGTSTVSPATSRRAALLVGQIDQARAAMSSGKTQQDKENAKAYGIKAASELKALNAGYDAGVGADGWPQYTRQDAPLSSPSSVKLTTKGFTERFQQRRHRPPTAAEIAAFEQEHPQ